MTENQLNPSKEIRSLTGLRGIAALYVVLYHFFLGNHFGRAETLVLHGYLSVDLFFVLSGFVMALTYGPEFRGGFKIGGFINFIYKRLGRVYPLYFVATLICFSLTFIDPGKVEIDHFSIGDVAANLLMIQAWHIAPGIVGPGWSISTEFACYLLFPLLLKVENTWRSAIFSAGMSIAVLTFIAFDPHGSLAGVAHRTGPLDIYASDTFFPLLRCFAGFVLGLVAFKLWTSELWIRRRLGPLHAGDVIALAIALLLAVRQADVAIVVLFVPLVVALADGQSRSARLLACRPVHWLGTISYSIYLAHWPIVNYCEPLVRSLLERIAVPHAYSVANAIMLPVTLLVAAITFRFIEKPARNWSRKWKGMRTPPIDAEPSAP